MFIEIQMYGPRQESRTLPWTKCQIFLETLLICNDIDKKSKQKFPFIVITLLNCHFYSPQFVR